MLDSYMRIIIICVTAIARRYTAPESPMQNLAFNLPRAAAPARPSLPRLRSEDLFRQSHELIIEHQGQEYRLRLTRNDKLILNK